MATDSLLCIHALNNSWLYACMQVSVTQSFLSSSKFARITAKRIVDEPCRRFLPKLDHPVDYYTLEDGSVRPINERYNYTILYYYTDRVLHCICPHTYTDQPLKEQNISHISYRPIRVLTALQISLGALKIVVVRATSELD